MVAGESSKPVKAADSRSARYAVFGRFPGLQWVCTDVTKCDGTIPCLRCKADNAICTFGTARQSNEMFYRSGYEKMVQANYRILMLVSYISMLERQQSQLVAGLQELYRRLVDNEQWSHSLWMIILESDHRLTDYWRDLAC